jgi:hypothetical protein
MGLRQFHCLRGMLLVTTVQSILSLHKPYQRKQLSPEYYQSLVSHMALQCSPTKHLFIKQLWKGILYSLKLTFSQVLSLLCVCDFYLTSVVENFIVTASNAVRRHTNYFQAVKH